MKPHWINRLRDSKALLQLLAILFIIAGLGYVVFPPNTTTQFFDASWPSRIWGSAMVIGGVLELIGLRTKIVDWSLLGLTFLWAGTGSLALGQTMVMVAPPPMLTRTGGTFAYWALMIFILARLVIVAADKRDGRHAQEQIDERD